jgi:zinc transporter, ZIP family
MAIVLLRKRALMLDNLPVWLTASAWGLLVSAGLIVGAVAGLFAPLQHRGITRVMAAGAGILIAAASLDLIVSAVRAAGPRPVAIALLIGAALFSLANALLANQAKHRKRCGMCVEQPTEKGAPGSGVAIAVGTLMDAIPEAIVLGLETARMAAPALGLVVAFALGNVAEALSSASGMAIAGRSKRYIFGLWGGATVLVIIVAAASAALAARVPPEFASLCNAFAAGALLAMVVETMIPEAAADAAPFNGLLAVVGFLALLLLIGAG